MGSRLELQTLLQELIDSVGSIDDGKVYFQTPNNLELSYPCIIYERDDSHTEFADNRPYSRTKRYQVTVIHRDPDNELPDKVEDLPLCSFDRYFPADDLNHYVFTLFF